MSELTLRSPGVSTREIDLSQPSTTRPQGVPAGIIGTAVTGPAFVPITFGNINDFKSTFGEINGKDFGPLAVQQWLKSATSCTFIRVLGVGDGKKRNDTTGVVNNAGFFVGEEQIQENGQIGPNRFANTGAGAVKGRTYFLGCFMSESNGSTIFSDAGIQSATQNVGVNAASTVLVLKSETPADFESGGQTAFTLTSTDGTSRTYQFAVGGSKATGDVVTGTTIRIQVDSINTYSTIADQIISAINNSNGHGAKFSIVKSDGSNTGDTLTITQAVAGTQGNTTIPAITNGDADDLTINGGIIETAFSGGTSTSGAVPILRGVLLAPSGVILHLSGNSAAGGNMTAADGTGRAASADGVVMGQKGGLTGSLELSTGDFVLLMNGFKAINKGDENPNYITASFDIAAGEKYFANVFNTDPEKIEEKGHLLYAHYDIDPGLAVITGSGAVVGGHTSKGRPAASSAAITKEDIAFLLTGSNLRGATSNLNNVPDYEDFRDRFSHAETSYFISQNEKKLFKLVALSPGSSFSSKYKVSIENIRPSTSKTNKYGSFNLIIRRFKDADNNKNIVENFLNLSLDPTADNYISRKIGDMHTYFDFDSDPESQKIITEGSHFNRSNLVRVVVSDDVASRNIAAEELPFGFRGPKHLVTSGSLLSNEDDPSVYTFSDILQRVVEPPIPYRNNLGRGLGLNRKIDTNLYWGIQFTRPKRAADLNKTDSFNESLYSYVKHFPTHRKDTTAFSVGDNSGVANINGSILDSDRFNYNKFLLSKVKVVTGSDTLANPEEWLSAVYIRTGSINATEDAKTRAFEVNDLKNVKNRKFAKFTNLFQGGSDGINIFDKDKKEFSNLSAKREIDDTNQGGKSDSTIAAYRKAIDVMNSKADVDIQILATPGMRHESITDYAISAVENRFDAMYIMDIEERNSLNTVITSSTDRPHVANTVTAFKNRGLDSSFAAAYFPNVTMAVPQANGSNSLISVPPSIAAIGALAYNDRIGHPWTAPAGYARGSVSDVENPSVLLNRDNLDTLYDADINPIAQFSGGPVIWGQKTLMQDQSALDRINVRRLLIDIRRKVRNVANTLLFEPNRSETLEKFTALVNPILQKVQSESGVERYKVVIDSSTTTQADVENNTIRGKIFVQPTRTAEYVALDFTVTNAGSDLI